MPPSAFIALLVGPAQACQRATGIPASFTIAQAALESSWGQLALGNNLFGVKADSGWHGPTVSFRTTEHVDGADVHPVGVFRAYPSWQACMDDHAEFFKQNDRYKACFAETTGEGWARAVAAAGYATDPAYADKLVKIIQTRGLARLDITPTTKATA
jgi:flagellar protein FlgJ